MKTIKELKDEEMFKNCEFRAVLRKSFTKKIEFIFETACFIIIVLPIAIFLESYSLIRKEWNIWRESCDEVNNKN